jgi:cyclopropane-fatty-acyl-phospholipid synthase
MGTGHKGFARVFQRRYVCGGGAAVMRVMRLVQTNRVPDWLVRLAIRAGLKLNTRRRNQESIKVRHAAKRALIAKLKQSPIAVHTDDANQQHYEVPAAFFQLVLGRRLKYSCCYWPRGVTTIDGAEEAMLRLTCERARLEDGMTVLDLGCGWGSLGLWIAERYPNSHVLALSNSRSQQEFIESQSRERGLENLETMTADVSQLELERQFDRVISIEMFEHMKNYGLLMKKIASWLRPEGCLFVHVFSHREFAYEFDASDAGNWMAQTFFSGGTMPSDDLLLHFQDHLVLADHWRIDGIHYARTLRAWLNKLDHYQDQVRAVLAGAYGADQETRWLVNWRLFFMACEETWKLNQGREYLVSHYLFNRRR